MTAGGRWAAGCAACGSDRRCRRTDDVCAVSRSACQIDALAAYEDPQVLEMARVAAQVEATGYERWDRATETIEFARRMAYRRLGLAFCLRLSEEAAVYHRRLEREGFAVVSAMCKAGAVPKESILGLREDEKVRPGSPEAMCNPVAQARLLADAEVDLNIVIGLCVGHDALFIQHSRGPVTVLVAKDRVFDNKPVLGLSGGSDSAE
jgi:uncharacterized metal-binding protein